MNENNVDFTPDAPNFKTLVRMSFQGLTNFPYIEEDFDALTNYGLLSKVVEYLNQVISNNNEQNDLMTGLYNAYVSLQDYVNDYFDNLDVQEEINNKLDEMAQDGSLTNLIKGYVDPIIEEFEETVNNNIDDFEENVNTSLNNMQTQINSVASGSPSGIYATVSDLTSANPDHTKIYLVLEDGKWYYYNNGWVAGGTYQATGVGENEIDGLKLFENVTIDLDKNNLIMHNGIHAGSWSYNENYDSTDYIEIHNGDVLTATNLKGTYLTYYDADKNITTSESSQDIVNINKTFTNISSRYVCINLIHGYSHTITLNGKSLFNQYNVNWLNINNKNIINNDLLGQKLKNNTIHPSKLMSNGGLEITDNQFWSSTSPFYTANNGYYRNTNLIEVSAGDFIEVKNTRATAIVMYEYADDTLTFRRYSYSATEFNPTVMIASNENRVGINIDKNYRNYEIYINGERIYLDDQKYTLDWLTFTEEQMNSMGLNSHIKDYKTLFIGDSITEHNSRANVNWVNNIVDWYNITNYTNAGMSGTGILRSFGGYPNWYTALDNYADDYQLILIMGDMNDWSNKVFTENNLGQYGDNTLNTFYGTMKLYLEKIINKYPLAKIGWITSTPRNQLITDTTDYLHGHSSIFEKATEIIKEMCNNYSIPVLDLYHNSNLYPWNSTNNTENFKAPNESYPDGIHPNDKGQLIMSYKIKGFINDNF